MREQRKLELKFQSISKFPCITHVQVSKSWSYSSFEKGFDGWSTSTFLRDDGSAYSKNGGATGPASAAHGSHYVYCETATPNHPNKIFDMSKKVPYAPVQILIGLEFKYHMYGGTIGTATLEVYNGTSWISAWTKSGNLGAKWQQASVIVAGGATALRFKYAGGVGPDGNFALDELHATYESVSCQLH